MRVCWCFVRLPGTMAERWRAVGPRRMMLGVNMFGDTRTGSGSQFCLQLFPGCRMITIVPHLVTKLTSDFGHLTAERSWEKLWFWTLDWTLDGLCWSRFYVFGRLILLFALIKWSNLASAKTKLYLNGWITQICGPFLKRVSLNTLVSWTFVFIGPLSLNTILQYNIYIYMALHPWPLCRTT